MELKKISEPIAVSAYSKQEAVELLSILRENGYTLPFNSEIDYTGWCGIQMYYKILPEKVVIYSYDMPKDYPQYTLKDFIHKMEKKETTEVKINIPEGYEIDKENSTFECIKFKFKQLTYKDVMNKLFGNNPLYYIKDNGTIVNSPWASYSCIDDNNATSKRQLEKLLAINKLMNVAKYLNGNWKPNWKDGKEKWLIYSTMDNDIRISNSCGSHNISAYFKTKELAQQAIKILGEDTIRMALSTD